MKSTTPDRGNARNLATTPWIASRCPATLVRLKLVRCPHSLAPTLVVLPSMSLGPPLHSLGSRSPAVMLFNASRGLSVSGSECVSLGHVNQVEQRAANARDGRNGIGTLLKRHRACGDFVQAVINRTGLVHLGQGHVNRNPALVAVGHQAVLARQLVESRVCPGS